MTTLEQATTPHGNRLTIGDDWRQGRGAYGGLTIAAAVRAIEAHVADPRRRVRALTAELPAPTLPGDAQVDVEILRAGKNLTVARAAIRQGRDVTTHVVATLAADREGTDDLAWTKLQPPEAPPWSTLPLVPMAPGASPEFGQHFEYRLVAGVPFTGGEPLCVGWVRARNPGPARDAAYIAAMMDVWWPAVLVSQRQPRPLATITYTLELLGDLDGLDPDAALLYRGVVPVAGNGYFVETRELWGADGRLIARNHQTFAVIK